MIGELAVEEQRRKGLPYGLDVPSLDRTSRDSPLSSGADTPSQPSLNGSHQDIMPGSDFTVPTSNVSPFPPESLSSDPLSYGDGSGRRGVFGSKVQNKYNVNSISTAATANDTLKTTADTTPHLNGHGREYNKLDSNLSDLSPAGSPAPVRTRGTKRDILSPPATLRISQSPRRSRSQSLRQSSSKQGGGDTVYTQSLLLGFAFMAIWSPQNVMAPNLTAIARDFGFTPSQRDLYLGANIALATGVLSLPISAGIGILTDMWNRKYLFCATVACGGLASLATGMSRSYTCLFFARLINGGCMSGSVPIAFSLLGDLFDTNERNAASSGLTAMMGLGIITGQVYAGMFGPSLGWWEPFYVSCIVTLVAAFLVLLFVREPVRGGKEEVLQDMLRQGTKYDRKLNWEGFIHAMRHNRSNVILMWQGFFSSIPWGIIFVFLNDYLSVNRGFSVQDATMLVAVFGIGCACGGVLGGYWGQLLQSRNRSYLPLFMSFTTFIGIIPFLFLLDSSFNHAGFLAITYSFLGGCIESLPSVNVRPCLINVNPPETRGAALTAANLIINVARGVGPSFITLMAAIFGANRQVSFNVTLAFFWIVTAIQLLFLAKTLPDDQDAMDSELAEYAEAAIEEAKRRTTGAARGSIRGTIPEDAGSIVSIEDRMTSFSHVGARESMKFIENTFHEIRSHTPLQLSCVDKDEILYENDFEDDDDGDDPQDREFQRRMWLQQQKDTSVPQDWDDSLIIQDGDILPSKQHHYPDENTPLV